MIPTSLPYRNLVLMLALSLRTVLGMPYNCFLVAGHNILGHRNCRKEQAFSDVEVKGGGGGGCMEAVYSLMIRSQSFSKPVPLDCEFIHFFLPLRWDRRGWGWVFPVSHMEGWSYRKDWGTPWD